jgi:hypothetical protein
LFFPLHQYINKIFVVARKPHAYLPLIRGYMNYAYNNPNQVGQLYEVVELGLNENDYDRVRPYYVLFETLLMSETAPWHADNAGNWLKNWMTQIVP